MESGMGVPKRSEFKSSEQYLSARVEFLERKLEETEKNARTVLSNHIHIDYDEFKELAAFVMCNDDPHQQADMEVVHSVLDQISINCLGGQNWVSTYLEDLL